MRWLKMNHLIWIYTVYPLVFEFSIRYSLAITFSNFAVITIGGKQGSMTKHRMTKHRKAKTRKRQNIERLKIEKKHRKKLEKRSK